MGCNYYARILPSENEKNTLKELIDKNAFKDIKYMTDEFYTVRSSDNRNGRIIHLGKASAGWQFLWNHNIIRIADGYMDENNKYVPRWKYDKVYDLNIDSIREFLSRPDVIIVSEYYKEGDTIGDKPFNDREIMTAEEFLDYALNKKGWTSKTYDEETNQKPSYIGYSESQQDILKHIGVEADGYQSDFIINGLRFFFCTDFT